MNARVALRALAIAIAALAAVDPTVTRSSSDRPFVSVVASSFDDSAAAEAARGALGSRFRPLTASFGGAGATVLVGDAIPDGIEEFPRPVFVVPRSNASASLAIERIRVAAASLDARIPVSVSAQALGAAGRAFNVSLRVDSATVASTSAMTQAADATVPASFSFTPTSSHTSRVRVEANFVGGAPAVADVAVPVARGPFSVLFHDARASWASTFVRRAIEGDPRFTVASRITTTRGAPSDANRPPRLDDRAALETVEVVVVGAADLLVPPDVANLERFMRERGGSVILLLDQVPVGSSPLCRLVSSTCRFASRVGGNALPIGAEGRTPSGLRAIELAWPSPLPDGSEPVAFTNVANRADTARHPVVWGMQTGRGHFVVSGALDAWRYRDAQHSSFDLFWRELIAAEAARAVPRVDVALSASVLRPGDEATARISLREASNPGLRASLNAKEIPLWSDGGRGTLTGHVRAPGRPGVYEVVVASGADTARAPLIVAADARPPIPVHRSALASFATSTGGRAVTASELPSAIAAAITPARRTEPRQPMRSPWWIVPFAVLLSAEWWLRRKRGLA